MLKPEQVPNECLIAFRKAHETGGYPEAIAAAINAWPGMDTRPNIYGRQDAILILPLPQKEPKDE